MISSYTGLVVNGNRFVRQDTSIALEQLCHTVLCQVPLHVGEVPGIRGLIDQEFPARKIVAGSQLNFLNGFPEDHSKAQTIVRVILHVSYYAGAEMPFAVSQVRILA